MATAPLSRDSVGDEWLDIKGASRYAKLSRHAVYDAVRTGGLRHVRVGGRLAETFGLEMLNVGHVRPPCCITTSEVSDAAYTSPVDGGV